MKTESYNSPNTSTLPAPLPLRPLALYRHPGLILALLVYLFLAFSYFFIVPIFEAPDEWTHTGHVKYIAEGNGLPVMLPGQGIWGGQQPPLYYATGAILIQPFDLSNFDDYLEQTKNPHASLGYALDPGNKNNYLHQPDENFPYHGLSLAVHVLRLYSMVFGVIAVIFTYLTAYEFILGSKFKVQSSDTHVTRNTQHVSLIPTIVALFVACQPMFAFITASVANEPANIAFCAIGLWLAQRYVLFGPSPKIWHALALGVALGLISLSKMTGLSFGLVVVVVMLQSAIATQKQKGAAWLLWRDGVIIGAAFLAVGGWWYWRNYHLYGDFFQQGLYKIYFNQTPQPLTFSDFLYHLRIGEVSFWATFGWLNLVAPDWVYSVYRIISRVGLIGVSLAAILKFVQRIGEWRMANKNTKEVDSPKSAATEMKIFALTPSLTRLPSPSGRGVGGEGLFPRENIQHPTSNTQHVPIPNPSTSLRTSLQSPISPLLPHLIFPIALAFSLARLVALEGGLQGRQLLPALGSMAIVIVWGWWVLTPARWRGPILGALVAVLLGLAIWLPYTTVARAYIPAPLLTEAELPADLHRLDLIYNDEMKLVGVELGAEVVEPGQRVPVTAYWQALKPMTTNYSVFVHLIGRDYQTAGQFNTYPGLGLRPTTSLEPGQIVVDTYPAQVDGGSEAPTRLLVNIGLFDFNEPGRPGIQPTTSDGNPASPTAGQLKLIPTEWPAPPDASPIATFADNIQLVDYSFDRCDTQQSDCAITLTWLSRGKPSTDYTVFIQLWQDGVQVEGFDSPPLNNDYPTSLWAADEVIVDPHPINLTQLPPGEYQIFAGLYHFASGERLPATTPDGADWPNYAVDLGKITINP